MEPHEFGQYFPKAVKLVEIPKPNGGKRPLGIPTVEDRVAQMVVVTKQNITNNMAALNEQLFHEKTSRTFYANLLKHYSIVL